MAESNGNGSNVGSVEQVTGVVIDAVFPDTLPDLRGCHILPGCGHWVQQERADEVNRLLVDWLKSL